MCQLWSLSPLYGFNWTGFCSYKSKFHCNVCLKYRRIPPELGFERLTVLFKIYTKCKNLDFFRMRYFENCVAMQSMCTCFAVTNIKVKMSM